MAVLEDTFRSVNGDWSTPKTVHDRVGLWSPVTVRHSLATLAKAGLIERREIPAHPFPGAEYRSNQPIPKTTPQKAGFGPLTKDQLSSAMKELQRRKRCNSPTSPAVADFAAAAALSTRRTA